MKRFREVKGVLGAFLAGIFFLSVTVSAWGQIGQAINAAEKLIQKEKEKQTQEAGGDREKASETKAEKKSDDPADAAKVVFSKSPIDAAKPEKLVKEFKAGDPIYGLIQVDKTWRDLLGKGKEDVKEIQVPIDMLVDGETIDFQYIKIKNEKAIDTKVLVLDIAPEPEKMTAYKDEGFAYGEGKGRRKIGPDQYTYNLSRLKPGKHTIKFQVRSYGDVFSAGEFIIEGEDYKPYAELREKVLKEMLNVGGMPKSQKTDAQLESQMMKLLLNAGWKNIRRLVIVDKDWWINRASGGDSPVTSRHIGAAVAAKAEDGSFYWCNVTFEQQKLIDGSFGPLELTRTGEKRPIKEENIDK